MSWCPSLIWCLCLLPAAYLCGSGWTWSRTPSLSLTYIRAALQMPVCLSWPRPSWTPAPPQSTALERTHPPTNYFMPRTFPATRAGWRGKLMKYTHQTLDDWREGAVSVRGVGSYVRVRITGRVLFQSTKHDTITMIYGPCNLINITTQWELLRVPRTSDPQFLGGIGRETETAFLRKGGFYFLKIY